LSLVVLLAFGCGTTVSRSGQRAGSAGPSTPNGEVGLGGGSAPTTGAANGAGAPGLAGSQAGSAGSAGGVRASTGPAQVAGASGPGVTGTSGGRQAPVQSGPIKVGFVVSDYTKAAAAVGFAGKAVSDPQQFFRWLVKFYNAHGGLAGRTIQPVYATVDGASNDYNVASQAACQTLTQDNHVELVLSNLWVNPTLTSCLLKAGVPQFEGTSEVLNDSQMLAQTPNLFVPTGLTTDREAAALINESVRQGWLTTKDKLGVQYDSCPYDTGAVNGTLIPLLKSYGIPYLAIQAFDCGAGFSDVGKFSAGTQNAELQMHSNKVTKVMFMQQGENGGLSFFSNYAQSQGWYPTYLVSSNALLMSTKSGGEMQKSQMVNVRGVGWDPTVDVDKPPTTELMRTCVQDSIQGGGQTPASLNDFLTMYAACNAFALGDTALRASGGVGQLPALRDAVERLGTSFVSVTSFGGLTRFGPGRHDGAGAVAPFLYHAPCDCFEYVGQPQPVP
jgi:hypothetical protein